MAQTPPHSGGRDQSRMTLLMRNVAVGLRKRLMTGIALAFAVLAMGELAVQLSIHYPEHTRLFIAGFVASSVSVLIALAKRR